MKKSLAYLLAGSMFLSSCVSQRPLEDYEVYMRSARENARETISDKDFWVKTEKKNPETEKSNWSEQYLDGKLFVSYTAQHNEAAELQRILSEQFGSELGAVSVNPSTNTVFFGFDYDNSETGIDDSYERYGKIKGLVEGVDQRVKQIGLEVKIGTVFADHTRDSSKKVNLAPVPGSDGIVPLANTYLPGGELSEQLRAKFGAEYGLSRITGDSELEVRVNQLESLGANDTKFYNLVYVQQGRKAEIFSKREVPIRRNIVKDNTLIAGEEFKEVPTFMTIIPHLIKEGSVVLEIETQLSELVPYQHTQTQAIVEQGSKIERVEVGYGEPYIISGYMEDSKGGIDRRDPWLSKIPVLGYFFKSSEESARRKRVIVEITPVEYNLK